MPPKERSVPVDASQGRDPSFGARREAVPRIIQPHGADRTDQRPQPPAKPAVRPSREQRGREADHDHEQAAGRHAQRLLYRPGLYGFADRLGGAGRWIMGPRWVRRFATGLASLIIVVVGCFGALWWRLGAGPINLDIATPWLAEAIEQNIGSGNTVDVGGTQIERTGRIRIAVRIRDIVVRDRDHAIVASAPKAEVRLSGRALLVGSLRAESLNLVDAVLAIRVTPDGYVTVSAGDTAKPLATGIAKRPAPGSMMAPPPGVAPTAIIPPVPSSAEPRGLGSLVAGLDWLDSLSLTGLDGQNLTEIGLKNGSLVVDDQQRGSKWNFENISLSLRRSASGGVAFRLGEDGAQPWSLRVAVGAFERGVRSVEVHADNVSASKILLALRVKDLTYSADLPLTGELKGELGRDGVPTFLRGKLTAGSGTIIDSDTPDYPMAIDSMELHVEWDAARRVLVAPFKIVSGANRITLLGQLSPPNDVIGDWQLGLTGGTILLAGADDETPLIFNRISIGFRFDTDHKRVVLTQADLSNGEVGIAGSGSLDYSGEPQLMLGFAGTPMSATNLKRIWPVLIVPEVREWVIQRIERGQLQRLDIGVNTAVKNLPRKGPPIPDDGLSVNIVASGVTVHPVDGMPSVHDADLKARVTGRTANVTIGQGVADTPSGRKLMISDFTFEVPDTHSKPPPARVKFKVDGAVPAAAEILNSDRLNDLTSMPIDPATSKGTFAATINLGVPVKGELTKTDTTYAVTADLNGFAADKLVMNQKLEANALKVTANNQGYQVKGDVKISGQAASLDYRKPAEGDADIKLQATLDDASRAKLGLDLGPAVSGSIPIKLSGKIASGDRDSKVGVEADLTALKLDNVLPGWVKVAGKSGKAVFNVVAKPQSTRFEDIVIESGSASIKGSLEVDQNGDLLNANFPTYSPSDGDKTSLKAERGADGVMRVAMRGDVFDGRGFLKSVISGSAKDDGKSKMKAVDIDLDLKLGAVAGYNGEALRNVDAKLSRRNGLIKAFTLSGKIGRDTPITAELKQRGQGLGRDVIYLETNDAGAFFRFNDMYSKVVGGQLSLAMDPPTVEPSAKDGLLNVRDFSVKGEPSLDRIGAGGPGGAQNGVFFTRLRAEFSRQNGQLTVREGVAKGPAVGGTIEGTLDYNANQVRMSGTFVPVYGLNNMFGQIPVLGLFLGGGSNEGLFAVTYEVVGTPSAPVLHINPISAMLPGVTRKIMEFNTGKQQNPIEFPQPAN